MRLAVHVAQKVGEGLGRRALLFREMSQGQMIVQVRLKAHLKNSRGPFVAYRKLLP
jgi:hypothetical protein